MKRIILLTLLTLAVNHLFSQTFTEQTEISLAGVYNSSVAWGDYDNDGDLDILLTGKSGSTGISKIYRNNGNNTFTEQSGISLTGVYYSSVAWGDYDNDEYLDILLTGQTNSNKPISKIFRNNGNNTFTEQTGISLKGVSEGSVAWGDYDNDGDLDILLTGATGSYNDFISEIYKNNGNNTFARQGISLTGVHYSSVAWGDYDNDGDLDILLTGYAASYGNTGSLNLISKIYRNNGNNSFTEQTGISLTGVGSGSVVWGDYDNDGDLDILFTGWEDYGIIISKIYKNNGNNTFTELTGISLMGVYGSSVAWGDYDTDGDLDILLTGCDKDYKYISKVYKNNGNNTFTEQTGISLPGVYLSSTAWGDYDNDGDLDILLTGSTSSTTRISKIYKNESYPINTSPTSPGNLMETVTGNNVIFTWDKATDNETPQNGLSYNLVIKSMNGKIIKGPLSDISNGIRKVVGIGNVGQNNFWTIRDLPEGIYSWSVQAIDHNYASSPFSLPGTFIVGNPVLLDKPETPEGAVSLCQNLSYSEYITSSVPGATSYNWSISPSDAGTITGDSTIVMVEWSDTFYGTAKISVTSRNNFVQSESSDSLEVVIKKKPEKPIVSKSGFTLKSNAENGNQWYKQGEIIPGANQQELTSTGDGNYYVIVTEEGCPSDPSDVLTITDVEILNSNELVEVYPNPASRSLSVISVDNAASVEYEFVDLLGKVIRKGNFFGKTVIETGSVIPGVYLLKVKNGKTIEIIKIIKK